MNVLETTIKKGGTSYGGGGGGGEGGEGGEVRPIKVVRCRV